MALASVRRSRKGVLALAALSASPLTKTSAFNHGLRRGATIRHTSTFKSAASSNLVGDDPSLTNDTDYEWLKQSRPMRIHARLVSANNGERSNAMDAPSAVTKIVHFQRHGQGTHNELYKQWTEKTGKPLDLSETDPAKNPLLLDHIIDSPLTQKGREQCAKQRPTARNLEGVELVICSPLVRALQTAHITFGDHLPYNTPRDVKWIAHEGIREELGTLMCNKRRPLSETELEFPEVDYSLLQCIDDEDVVWSKHEEKTSSDNDGIPKRESTEDMSHRAYDFLVNFLHHRPEQEIAVVGHSAWLLAMTGAVLDLGDEEGKDLITPMFGQAELRSLELVFLDQ